MNKLMFLMGGLLLCAALSYAQGPARGPDKATTEDAKMEADARHELEVARQYFKLRKAYVAALSRAEEIVAGYPTFSKRDEALYIAGMSSVYLAKGKGKQKSTVKPEDLRAQAREFLTELVNSFPKSEFFSEAEAHLKKLEEETKKR